MPPNIPVRPISPNLPDNEADGVSGEGGVKLGDDALEPERIVDRSDGTGDEAQRPRGQRDPGMPTPE